MRIFKSFSLKTKAIFLSAAFSATPVYCNMPVIDFSNLTQAIMDFQNQIQQMLLFEDQLEQMGINVDRISGFISEMQGAWDNIQNLNQQALNLSGIESLLSNIKSDCDELQSQSEAFRNFINEQKKKLKGMDSSTAEKQACMNALANEEYTDELSNNLANSAKEKLKNGDENGYRRDIEKAQQIKEKRQQNIAKTQSESVNKVLNSYNLYTEGSASNGSKYNMLYRKDTQDMMAKIQKQLSDTKIKGMNEKEKQEALLRTQAMMLQILVSQYEVMQNMNAMYASMALDKIGNTTPKEREKIQKETIKQFPRNSLGQPDFIGEMFKKQWE